MDKSNRKYKQILYKYIKANTNAIWQHLCCTNHQLKYPSPNCSIKNKKDKSHTKEPTFENGDVYKGITDQENGPKADKGKKEIATGL